MFINTHIMTREEVIDRAATVRKHGVPMLLTEHALKLGKDDRELTLIYTDEKDIIDMKISYALALEAIKKKIKIGTGELIANDSKFLVAELHYNYPFEVILGGDGRSQPWSETRYGKVIVVITLPEYELSLKQQEFLKAKYELLHSPDMILFK